MKTIQKITLALLTMVSVSSLSAAVLELDTGATDAEMAGVITGAAKKTGAGALTLSGDNSSSLAALEIAAGSVAIAANNNLNSSGPVTFNGGDSLDAGSLVAAIPAVVMSAAGIIKLENAAVTIGALSGSAPLDLVNAVIGTSAVIMTGDVHLGACNTILSLAAASAHVEAGSSLPATASFSGTLNLDADVAAGGAVTMGASGIVSANENFAADNFISLIARKIVFASGKVFSQDVTAG